MPLQTPQIIAHRGAGTTAPENTLAAIHTAIALGVDGVECDVQCSQDGEAVLMHDTTLDRTTDGKGDVKSYSMAALRQFDAGSWFGDAYTGERIPTLQELINIVDGQLKLYLDVREVPIADRIIHLLTTNQALDWCTVITFSDEVLTHCRTKQPDVNLTRLIHPDPDIPFDIEEVISDLMERGIRMIGLPPKWVTEDLMHQSHKTHIQVLTGPLDNEQQLSKSLPLCPDLILTNRPDLVTPYVKGATESSDPTPINLSQARS